MQHDQFYSGDPYHVLLAILGAAVILAHWLPRFVSTREPAAAPLMIMMGAVVFWAIPGLPSVPDPRENPRPWELVSELAVIVALFAAGMRIDSLRPWSKWTPTLRLLVIAMPLTIAAVATLGYGVAGMTVAGAIVLGAVLAPTDPVLASDVQVGPPHEGAEHPVRFTLTTEAALNDGLAFPFVYLGLIVASHGLDPAGWGLQWLGLDVVYRLAVGAGMGFGGGWALGQVLFLYPPKAALAETASGVVALAGVLLCYGSTELAEGYGFIAVAVMGLTLRRVESSHRFHRRLHDFCETIEHALTAVLLVSLGSALPLLFADISWTHALIALMLILVIRPLAASLSLVSTRLRGRDRTVVAVYGVRGIGSIYYLAYAASHIEFADELQLWSLIGLVILVSTLLHGFTVGWAMKGVRD
jgi:sodium/hydrogen antiporter